MNLRIFFFLLLAHMLFQQCKEEQPNQPLLKCVEDGDKNEELLCYFYYKNKNIWDSLLLTNVYEQETYRLQYFSHYTNPLFYLHSQVYFDENDNLIKKSFLFSSNPDTMFLKFASIDTIEVRAFSSLVDSSLFWQTDTKCNFCDKVGDGDTYILEGWKNGEHRIIHRDSPETVVMYLRENDRKELKKLLPFLRMMKGNTDAIYGN